MWAGYFQVIFGLDSELFLHLHPVVPPAFAVNFARMAELVDALVSNTCGKPCRFDSGSGYTLLLEDQRNFLESGMV